MSRKIFISYRRQDSPSEAISIAQFLEREFGRGSVFMDVDIHAGANFPIVLDQQLAQCKVLVAVIGPNWLDAKNSDGQRRLDEPEDWVRLEICRALARQIIVIPVCVNDAKLPERLTLPEAMRGLIDHQAAFVRTTRFRNDMAALVRDIRAIQGPLANRRIALIAAGLLLAVVFGAMWARNRVVRPSLAPPLVAGRDSVVDSRPQSAGTTQPAGQIDAVTNARASNLIAHSIGQKKEESLPVKLAPVTMKGSIEFRSDTGDYIGAGKSWSVGNADGVFTTTFNGGLADVTYRGDDDWDLTFAAPEGQHLMNGIYTNATRSPFNSPVKPGLSVSGAGRGCNTLTGQFNIRQIISSGTQLKRLLVDFEQHCEGGVPALSGTIDLTAME